MRYWLDIFTPKSWSEFRAAGSQVSGFPESRWKTVKTMQVGDILVCYMRGKSCWFGLMEVISKAFWDDKNIIWTDAVYPCRIPVRPILIIHPDKSMPAKDTISKLDLFGKVRSGKSWGMVLRKSPRHLSERDGSYITEELQSRKADRVDLDIPKQGELSLLDMVGEVEEPIHVRAAAFETKMVKFLKNLDFKDVNGGSNFRIGGIQVDACGGHEDTLFVLECTTARKKEEKNVREKLKALRGVMPILSKGFHKEPQYLKYTRIKYVLAVSNIEIKQVDKDFADESPKIYLWDEQFIQYYQNLYSVIGSATRYNLLGEMGIQPRTQSLIQVPAWATLIGNSRAYSFFIDPQILLQAAYVARREFGNEKYYQRILQKKRISNVRAFIKKGKAFPNSIIIAFEKPPDFTPYPEINKQYIWWPDWLTFGCLSFPANYRSCWIIDGQHRLYSFSGVHSDAKISAIAFHKIPIEKQAEYFIEINKEQKPVSPDLIWDLEGEMRPQSEDGIISNIVKRLNKYAPLKNKIYVPLSGRKVKKQLNFSGICLSIQRRHLTKERSLTMTGGQKNPLYSDNFEQTVEKTSKALSLFFERIGAIFKDEEKNEFAFTNVGVNILIGLFEVIVSDKKRIPSSEELDKYLEALQMLFEMEYPDKKHRGDLRKMGSSEAGRTMILTQFVIGLRDLIGEKSFASHIPTDDFNDRIRGFERKLSNFIFTVLGIESEKNLAKCAVPNLCERVILRYKKEVGKGFIDCKLADQLTFGECKEMVQYAPNLDSFKKIFVATKAGFTTKEEMDGALQSINDYSANLRHEKPTFPKYKQRELLSSYIDVLTRCMEEYERTPTKLQ
jgi:DGQHR domain-containing protein